MTTSIRDYNMQFEKHEGLIRSPAQDCFITHIYNPPHSVVQKVSKVERKIFDRLKNEPRPKAFNEIPTPFTSPSFLL